MKKTIFIAISCIFLSVCFADNSAYGASGKHSAATADKIAFIRQVYATVNTNLPRYKVVEYHVDDQSTEGGYVRIYSQNGALKKVEEAYFGETGKSIYQYYYDNDRLYFIFDQNFYYNAPIYFDKPDLDLGIDAFDINQSRIEEDRYYFYNGKMIRWLDKQKNAVSPSSQKFLDKQDALLKRAILY